MGCSNSIAPSTAAEFSKDWRIVFELGEGSHSYVYEVKHKRSSRVAALKVPKGIDKCAPWSQSRIETKRIDKDGGDANEARLLKKVGRHKHVVDLIDVFAIAGGHVLLMERCEGSLRCGVVDMQISSGASVARTFYQMTSAIAYVHSLSIGHFDVKPGNFLHCGGDDKIIKLCDFGCAKILPLSGQLFGIRGTPVYMSPEMVGSGPYNLKTDVWSLGATWYAMLYGEAPYTTVPLSSKCVKRAIATGIPEPTFQGRSHVSQAAKEAVSSLLHRSMSTRMSASQALKLPFLNYAPIQLAPQTPTTSKSNEMLEEIESQSTQCEDSDRNSFAISISGHSTPTFRDSTLQRGSIKL